MKTYALIPSRFGSSRFPGKPLAVLAGKPLVVWVVEAVSRAKTPDAVVVATDDERIAEAVRKRGGTAVMTPSDLPSGTDRIACAARAFLGGDFGDGVKIVGAHQDFLPRRGKNQQGPAGEPVYRFKYDLPDKITFFFQGTPGGIARQTHADPFGDGKQGIAQGRPDPWDQDGKDLCDRDHGLLLSDGR